MANMVISMAIFSSTKEYFSFFAKYSALEEKFTFEKIVISCMDIFCEKTDIHHTVNKLSLRPENSDPIQT